MARCRFPGTLATAPRGLECGRKPAAPCPVGSHQGWRRAGRSRGARTRGQAGRGPSCLGVRAALVAAQAHASVRTPRPHTFDVTPRVHGEAAQAATARTAWLGLACAPALLPFISHAWLSFFPWLALAEGEKRFLSAGRASAGFSPPVRGRPAPGRASDRAWRPSAPPRLTALGVRHAHISGARGGRAGARAAGAVAESSALHLQLRLGGVGRRAFCGPPAVRAARPGRRRGAPPGSGLGAWASRTGAGPSL